MNLNVFDGIDGLIDSKRPDAYANMDSSPDTPSRLPDNVSLAMAYVPFQQWGDVYSMDEALNRGTLFPDLEFPFERGGTRK